jgi:erythromycin esterase-like protein
LARGELVKERFGKDAVSLGCGTYAGTVAAAHEWGGDMQIMEIRPALEGSYKFLAHQAHLDSFCLDLREGRCDEGLRKELLNKRLQRFIGAVYSPETEQQSHYSVVELSRQFDRYILWWGLVAPPELSPDSGCNCSSPGTLYSSRAYRASSSGSPERTTS